MLQEGQAHDAFESLHIANKTFNYNLQFKTNQHLDKGLIHMLRLSYSLTGTLSRKSQCG